MAIEIKGELRQQAMGNNYYHVTLATEKHEATVTVCRGKSNYVGVCVHNAMNRAWRGLGRQFGSKDEAVANYKTAAIKAMIEEACRLAG